MQNKGFIKVVAVLLVLACLFYLSFSGVTYYYESKAEKMGAEAGKAYLDSLKNEKVWLWSYTLKQAQEMEIGLGLDLKGGMNVILEVSVPDVLTALSGDSPDPDFKKALDEARAKSNNSQSDFITLFVRSFQALKGTNHLNEIFSTQALKGLVNTSSTDKEIEAVLRTEVNAAINNSFNVLRTRIDRFGVAQPNIQTLEGQMGRIMVEMPGVKEPERVRKLLQGSANLEFWETYYPSAIVPYLSQLDQEWAQKLNASGEGKTTAVVATDSTTAAPADSAAAPTAATGGDIDLAAQLGGATKQPAASIAGTTDAQREEALRLHPLAALLQFQQPMNVGSIVGYAMARDTAAINKIIYSAEASRLFPSDLRLCWGVKQAEGFKGEVFELYALRASNAQGSPALEGDVIASAKDDFDRNGRPAVSMTMNADGSRAWAQITRNNIDHSIAIVLDGLVYSAPNVQNEITGGNSSITGSFTTEDTKDLANVLNTGKMPAPAHIVQEEMVGPSLGAASIQAGFLSCVVAFVLLMIFMCAFYGFTPGMVANGALLLNFFLTFGVLTSFQAALTLSGIAGLVLSLGMAVDANVLIYERTKEELRAGKNIRTALADGYSNAFSAIFDSNLTSIITAIILFNFGTGPIRGFATTLAIGIVASFFTAVWCTRIVFEHFMNKDKWLGLTFSTKLSRGFLENSAFAFMSKYRTSFTIFGIAILVSIISFATRGLSEGIDFTGGRNFVIQFEQPTQPETVAALLQQKIGTEGNASALALGTDGKTIRVTTNYRIADSAADIDEQVERFLYESLKAENLIKADYKTFIDRDNHTGGSIVSSQKVGPSVAKDMTYGAIISVLLSLAAIFVYILIRFRNVSYSVGSVIGLVVDTVLIIGMYSLCWGWLPFSLEVDQTFIGAVLTAIGYSINDKVVVFDRIRENFNLHPTRDPKELFNSSLNSTLSRTLITSGTTFLVLIVIFLLGGDSIRSFSFAMILGVVFGTLTSIFLSAPIAYLIYSKRASKAKAAPAVAKA